jgi:hypothetical protein
MVTKCHDKQHRMLQSAVDAFQQKQKLSALAHDTRPMPHDTQQTGAAQPMLLPQQLYKTTKSLTSPGCSPSMA